MCFSHWCSVWRGIAIFRRIKLLVVDLLTFHHGQCRRLDVLAADHLTGYGAEIWINTHIYFFYFPLLFVDFSSRGLKSLLLPTVKSLTSKRKAAPLARWIMKGLQPVAFFFFPVNPKPRVYSVPQFFLTSLLPHELRRQETFFFFAWNLNKYLGQLQIWGEETKPVWLVSERSRLPIGARSDAFKQWAWQRM